MLYVNINQQNKYFIVLDQFD